MDRCLRFITNSISRFEFFLLMYCHGAIRRVPSLFTKLPKLNFINLVPFSLSMLGIHNRLWSFHSKYTIIYLDRAFIGPTMISHPCIRFCLTLTETYLAQAVREFLVCLTLQVFNSRLIMCFRWHNHPLLVVNNLSSKLTTIPLSQFSWYVLVLKTVTKGSRFVCY